MIQLKAVSKQMGAKVLFDQADVFIDAGARIALIGPNGAGKSTLVKMIMGELSLDGGKRICSSHLRLGCLSQELPRHQGGTVLEQVLRLGDEAHALTVRKAELEIILNNMPDADDDKAMENYNEAIEELGQVLTHLEVYEQVDREAQAKKIVVGMGFAQEDFEKSLDELSGGWLMRVEFCRLLLASPDLLILDEPTNHLDLETIMWLEKFLAKYPGALLIISHDKAFLNNLVTEVVEIDQQKIFQYRGDVSDAALQKVARHELLKAQYENQQAKIAHLQEFVDKNRAKASKARQAQSRVKMIEKMQKIDPNDFSDSRKTMRFRFPAFVPGGKQVLALEHVSLNFGEKTIFEDVNWTLTRGSKVAVVGVNGAGKTTLLRILSQTLAPPTGHVLVGHDVKVGYYAQHQSDTLNMQRTIFEELEDTAPDATIGQLRSVAGAFLFSGDSVFKRCGQLSGGEKARVALAKLLLVPSNCLILDEPTNHLDAESKEILQAALLEYTGTLVVVSHDRDFMGPIVKSVLEVHPCKKNAKGYQAAQLISRLGTYEEYLVSVAQAALNQSQDSRVASIGTAPKKSKPSEKKSSSTPPPSLHKKMESIEHELSVLHQDMLDLDNKIEQAVLEKDFPVLTELQGTRKKLLATQAQKEQQWETFQQEIDSLG
jgi:ATP-binding cassette subfamily F protein 3